MINNIPDEVYNFFPPDYVFDGSEVLEMIKDMPVRPNYIENRKPSFREDMYVELRNKHHPDRVVLPFGKESIEVFYLAVQEMYKIFNNMKGDYTIEKYNVLLSIHIDHDIINVAFCPKTVPTFEGSYLEIPCGGIYTNGPGVDFFYSLSDYTLIRRIFMR